MSRDTDATRVARLSSPTTALTSAVALAATVASVEGLAEMLAATAALTVPMAWAIGSVIDLAVIVLALQAREAVITGRGGSLEMGLTWAASVASGVASASWQFGHAGAQAAAVRLLLPLVAACLWHLSLVGTRAAADARPARRQWRASRLALNLALAQADASGSERARRRERRARRAVLRHMAATSVSAQDRDLHWWRDTVASVSTVCDRHRAKSADGTTFPEATMRTDDAGRASDTLAAGVTPPASARQLVAEALREHPDATSAQIHDMLGGACSLRTVQRHRAAIARQQSSDR